MLCRTCSTKIADVRSACATCGRLEEPVCIIGLTGAVLLRLTAYAIVLLIAAIPIVAFVSPAIGSPAIETITVTWRWMAYLVAGIAVFAGTIVLHEAVHGVVMRMYGAHPRFGVGRASWWMPYAYATAPGHPFTVGQLAIIGLAPFVLISIATLVLMRMAPAVWGYAALAFAVNFSGSAGDLWLLAKTMEFRRCADLWMVDIADRLAIYTPDPAALGIVRRLEVPRRRNVLFTHLVIWWSAIVFVLFIGIVPTLIVLDWWGVKEAVIGVPWYPFLTFGPAGFVIYPMPICAAALLLAIPLTCFVRPSGTNASDDRSSAGAPRPAFL
jgi:hypothetical protein